MSEQRSEEPIAAVVVEPPDAAESRDKVLVLLFVVLGPLALGTLWRSSRFSPAWKVVLTTLTLGQFVLVVWILWCVVNWWLAAFRLGGLRS